ncbi:MAG: hypothetical protein JSV92_03270 [archaeon]|nr:MAG: hypothetical protein JSV92_03270 [archaeon]
MANFRSLTISINNILETVPVEEGPEWDYVSVYLKARHSLYNEPRKRVIYRGKCSNSSVAEQNKKNALRLVRAGYLIEKVITLKNSYTELSGRILSGDIQVFADPSVSSVSIKKELTDVDSRFLKGNELIPENFDPARDRLIKVNGIWFGESEASDEWQRLNR